MSIKETSIQGEKEQQQQEEEEEEEEEDPLEYEEWDGKSPFWIHCAAGSIAGVAEHVSVYPLDTVKTHIQCATCPRRQQQRPAAFTKNTAPMNMWTTIRHIVSQPASTTTTTTTATIMEANAATTTTTSSALLSGGGYARLFRGVQTVLVGCIPAHALYFSSYEAVKHYWNQSSSATANSSSSSFSNSVGMAVAGAAAVLGHDVVMTPLDTIKQRLQLGHYNNGMGQAAREMILREGGILALYRSFPVTLLTNVPYGAIMVSTNEWAKQQLQLQQQPQQQPHSPPSVGVCLMASSFAGMVASFLTTPLDRIKTVLQIQELQPVCLQQKGKKKNLLCTAIPSNTKPLDWNQAWTKIVREEGYWGLWRGCVPRMLSHTPAVAISWTTYEYCKQLLLLHQQQQY